MKTLLMLIAANMVPLTSVFFAGYLAVQGSDGWGWFLVVALLTVASWKQETGGHS